MASRISKKMSTKTRTLRNELWPEINEEMLWSRTKQDGFTTIPRTMSHIMNIMNDLSNGKPLSSTYFVLWCRVFDENMVTISNPKEWAYESGFSGQRAEQTWRQRMELLVEFGFIKAKPGASGDYNYVLILNPYIVIKELIESEKLKKDERYNALVARMIDIGATFNKGGEIDGKGAAIKTP